MLWRREQKSHMHRSQVQGHLGVSPQLCQAPLSRWAPEKDLPPWGGRRILRRDLGPKSTPPTRCGPASNCPVLPPDNSLGREAYQRGLGSKGLERLRGHRQPCPRRKRREGVWARGEGLVCSRGEGEGTRTGPQGWLRASPQPPWSLTLPGPPSTHT